jgi:hypothetical protein
MAIPGSIPPPVRKLSAEDLLKAGTPGRTTPAKRINLVKYCTVKLEEKKN